MKKVVSCLFLIVCLLMSLTLAEDAAISCERTYVSVRNGETKKITVTVPGKQRVTASTESSKIATASLGWYDDETDDTLTLSIKGTGVGSTNIRIALRDDPEQGVDIIVSVTPNSEERKSLLEVYYISDREFFYQTSTESYLFLFSLMNKDKERIAAPMTVDLLIVNDLGETVYSKTHYVTTADFGEWTSSLYGQRLRGSIYIPPEDITPGLITEGKVTATVYSPSYISFDPYNIETDDLPQLDLLGMCSLEVPQLPVEIQGTFGEKVKVTAITSSFTVNDAGRATMTVSFAGEKLYDRKGELNNDACSIPFKLYDAEGYVIKSNTHATQVLCVGEKFRQSELVIRDLEPGSYRIVLYSK